MPSPRRHKNRTPPARLAVLWMGSFLLLLLPSTLLAELLPPADRPDPSQPLSWPSLHYEFMGFQLPEDAFPLSLVFVGDPVDELTADDVQMVIEEAAGVWNDVPCSYARLQWGGFRDSLDEVSDDELPVYFRTGTGELADRIAWTVLSPGTGPQGMSVVLNHPRYRWELQASPFQPRDDQRFTVDFTAVLAHELGHVLGLAHTFAHNVATMSPNYLPDGSQKVLSADDKLGLCQLYPASGDECQTDSQCPGAACVAEEHGAVCDIPFGAIGEYCGLDLSHCADYCHFDDPEIGSGYCSTTCGDDGDCPEHLACETPPNFTTSVCLFAPVSSPQTEGCTSTNQKPPPSLIIITLVLSSAAVLRRRRS